MQPDQTVIVRPPPPAAAGKKKSLRAVVGLIGGGLVGGALGFFGVRYGMDVLLSVPGPKLLKLVAVVALPVVWLVVVGFHELGHIFGGWLVGGRFMLWVTGPFMLRRTPAGVRPHWNRSVNIAGGMAVCLPLDPTLMTPRRAAVMILGGPLASLVLCVGALWLAAGLAAGEGQVSAARALIQNVTLFTAGLSLLIFLVTAFPGKAGGFKSDGKRVYELMRGGPHSQQEAALLVLSAASLAGQRPADYDPGLVERVLALRDGSLFDLYGNFSVYYQAADRGNWAAAQGHLDYVLAGADQMAPYMQDILRCEYAWLLAGRTDDAATARAWLESAGALDFDPATRLRAEAMVLLAEGKNLQAAAKAREGLIALQHKSLSPVKSAFAVDALESILARAAT